MKLLFKILWTIIGIIVLFLILLLSANLGKSTQEYIEQAKINVDTQICQKIPILRYHIESTPSIIGDGLKVFHDRDYCVREARTIYPKSSGIYRFNSEKDMKIYYSAVRDQNPSTCLTLSSQTGISYCFEELKNSSKNPKVCEVIGDYSKDSQDFLQGAYENSSIYNQILCQAEMIVKGNIPLNTCESYNNIYRALCYQSVRETFNMYVNFPISLGNTPPYSPLTMKDIPNQCNNINSTIRITNLGTFAQDYCHKVYDTSE